VVQLHERYDDDDDDDDDDYDDDIGRRKEHESLYLTKHTIV